MINLRLLVIVVAIMGPLAMDFAGLGMLVILKLLKLSKQLSLLSPSILVKMVKHHINGNPKIIYTKRKEEIINTAWVFLASSITLR